MTIAVRLRQEWLALLEQEFEQEYMRQLGGFLRAEKAAGKVIYPAGTDFFAALEATPPSAVKVVILGQDPYHGPGQAHGLSFSVKGEQKIPPSLRNIFRELHEDEGLVQPAHGDLSVWAERGVLLLNSVLSVERGLAGSHQGKGWEQFTDAVIAQLNESQAPVVFMLWGAHAQRKGAGIDRDRHCVLTAPHPSPLSAHRGFLGCRHFSRANAFLIANQREPVDWSLSS
jgi:uracil-DNA glycosylase